MGCDIHMMAEVKRRKTLQKTETTFMGNSVVLPEQDIYKWEVTGKVFPNPYHDPGRPNKVDPEDGYEHNPKLIDAPYRGRNYFFFGILANVRWECPNGFGDGRGLPADLSKEGREFMESMAGDGHSHSYLTLEELLNFRWENVKDQEGNTCSAAIPLLEKLSRLLDLEAGVTADDIRIIFFFDN